MYNVYDIAEKLLHMAADEDRGELMSNLKLQKMLYYEQGYHLAAFGTPLFEDEIVHWAYGPVVPEVYRHYKPFGHGGITPSTPAPIRLRDAKEEQLFEDVFQDFIEFSAYGLMRETHKEPTWRNTQQNEVISKESMRDFFKSRIDD